MVSARSAFTLALLLGSAVLSFAEEEQSSSLEDWEIEEEAVEKAATDPTHRKVPRGFVTPRPFVVDHPLFSSTWAAWSAWSFCANNLRIRVRACNTVRGFSCVGRNQETEPCANSLYHHHPARPSHQPGDYDVPDPYEDDRIEAIKQLYPDESPADVLERRRPNPNFLRIGTTAAPISKASEEVVPTKSSSEIQHPTSIEKQEEVEEKDIEKEKEAGQEPEVDFKKAKGAKTETKEVPLQAEIEGALEKLEVHRNTETRRQHSSNFQTAKAPYAHDGSMGTGYTLIRNVDTAISTLDLLESSEEATRRTPISRDSAAVKQPVAGKNDHAKMQKSKAALAKISQLLDYEIDALEKKVTTVTDGSAHGGGLRAVFQSRGEEAPSSGEKRAIDKKFSRLEGAFVGARSTTASPGRKHKGSNDFEVSDYADVPMTPRPKTVAKKEINTKSTLYDEAVLDTDKATYDQYEEWIGDDKGSKEIINRRTNVKKGGRNDANIPIRPTAAHKASRTTTQTGGTSATTVSPVGKQKKINFDNSDFLKEILVEDFSDYQDVTGGKKLDGDAQISPTATASPRPPPPNVSIPSRSDQMTKVHELENLLGLPHQGLMDETIRSQTNPVVWATPTPQFRSEGAFQRRKKVLKKINRAKIDVDNVEVDKNVNMIDSDDHVDVLPIKQVQQKTIRKKVLRKKLREQPALIDNDDYSGVKGYSPYPSMKKPVTKGPLRNKAVSFGITGKRHRTIHDGQKGQEILKSHKMLFRNRYNLRKYLRIFKSKKAKVAPLNDDTVRALDWMMHSLTATDLVEPARTQSNQRESHIQKKYQHARVGSHARAEINAGIQQAVRKTTVVDSVAIGSPHTGERRPAPARPSKVLQRKKLIVQHKSTAPHIHDSDLIPGRGVEGDSKMRPLHRSSALGISKMHHKKRIMVTQQTSDPVRPTAVKSYNRPEFSGEQLSSGRENTGYETFSTTPLPEFPPDLQANPPRQKSITPVLEHQPTNLIPPPLDEALDQVRYPRNGAYGTGFELDGSSPDAASYVAAEATARPAKALPRRHRARGVTTVTGVERKALIGGAYTSSSGVSAFPSKFVDQKTPPRQPVAGLPEQYLMSVRSGSSMVDSDTLSHAAPAPKTTLHDSDSLTMPAKKPAPFVMHEGSMDERNTIAAEIERLEALVNSNKEHFNAPTITDKDSKLALPKEFEPLLSDPRLFEDALKEIKEENKALGINESAIDALLLETSGSQASLPSTKKRAGSDARWSKWGDWGECLCGQQLRTRACETANGTQVSGCTGSTYESRSCTGGSCPTA